MSNEQILVFPADALVALGTFEGFSTDMKYAALINGSTPLEYRDKPAMEIDPAFKQIIPYVVFIALPAGGPPQVLSYLRGKGGGEARLHDKVAVGIGGHINNGDTDYATAMARELREEIETTELPFYAGLAGFVNDDRSLLGAVHFGVVHLFIYASAVAIKSKEEDALSELAWRNVDDVLSRNLETWSSFCLLSLLDAAIAARKSFGK